MFSVKGKYDYLIVFLGNPGTKYENTRHNAGFIVADYISEKLKFTYNKARFLSKSADVTINGKKTLIIKPQTFMNLSGDAVVAASKYYKILAENIIVVYDEVALNVGTIRIKCGGSSAGHNGISDILSKIDDKFIRIRIGVGQKPNKEYNMASWVLGKIPKEDRKLIDGKLDDIYSAIELIVDDNLQKAMNIYN